MKTRQPYLSVNCFAENVWPLKPDGEVANTNLEMKTYSVAKVKGNEADDLSNSKRVCYNETIMTVQVHYSFKPPPTYILGNDQQQ